MTQTIFKDGRDKYVVIPRIISVNNTTGEQNPVFGTSDEELLSSSFPNLYFCLYKNFDNSENTQLLDILWSNNTGLWKTKLPANSITGEGSAYLTIMGSNSDNSQSLIPVAIEINITQTINTKLQDISTQIFTELNSYGVAKSSELPSIDTILDEIIDSTHHTIPKSFARLLYILYCGEIGNITNTKTSRTIKDENNHTLVSNSLIASNNLVNRSGGHE